jgi:hypothetical protein
VKRAKKATALGLRFVAAGCAFALAAMLSGCAGLPVEQLPPSPPSFRMAALDFAIPPEWRNPQMPDKMNKEMKGWWFGARDVWHNPGMGRLAADLFAHEINSLPFIHLVSREDIRYYMADKRTLIRSKLDEKRRALEQSPNPDDRAQALRIQNMTEADYDRDLELLPPREVGRELKADRVLVGRIYNIYLAHNRTIHWYWSSVDLEVGLVDVETGKVVWFRRAQFTKNFTSTSLLLEMAAREMVEMMKREHFYQP